MKTQKHKRMTLGDFLSCVDASDLRSHMDGGDDDEESMCYLYVNSIESAGPDVIKDRATCTRVSSTYRLGSKHHSKRLHTALTTLDRLVL